MRTFLRIAKEWQLTEPETRAVLGKPTRLTLMTWSHDARRRKHLRLPPEVLKRITW